MARDFAQPERDPGVQHLLPRRGGWHRRMPVVRATRTEMEAQKMTNKEIYDKLRAAGLTAEGVCGLMGNMMAESTMKPNIVQRGMTKLSDEDYTSAADNGTIDFIHDSVGYGYIQLTYHTRKAKYLAYCKQLGKSVGDAETQINFIILELTADYPMVMLTLRTSHDMYECTKQVCEKYENPAVWNTDARYRFAQQFYNEFCGSGALSDVQDNIVHTNSDAGVKATIMILQLLMNYAGYWCEVTGEKSKEFLDALHVFIENLER